MTVHLSRGYQTTVVETVEYHWAQQVKNVMAVLPTGGGKTFVIARLVEKSRVSTACIAHRAELVAQMSVALAREGVRHRVVGPETLQRACTQAHMEEFGRSYYDPTSNTAVCGVDTLVRMPANDPWFASVGLWVTDECHHLTAANKWGKACQLFPNAKGLGVTATPIRGDGLGLGRHADGLIDKMVVGPGMRELIDDGYLTDYQVYAPPSDLNLAEVQISASGDYNPEQLRAARRKSHITGDVVSHYCRLAMGKLGVTFDTDIQAATETVAAFRAAGVPAEVLSGKTPAAQRAAIIRRFRAREIWQIVSVDVISEGFDLPAIEVVSFARATQSFALFCQQLGRALRLMVGKEAMSRWEQMTPAERRSVIAASGKPFAIIIDHVGNFLRHGPPDRPRVWSLDRRETRARSAPDDAIPLRVCASPTCNRPYERVLLSCPYCGDVPEPAQRSKPEYVDGDLVLLDPNVLAALRGEIARIDGMPRLPGHLSGPATIAAQRNHMDRQRAQAELRRLMGIWGGMHAVQHRPDQEVQRRFFHAFHLDVLSAQALGVREAEALTALISSDLTRNNIAQ